MSSISYIFGRSSGQGRLKNQRHFSLKQTPTPRGEDEPISLILQCVKMFFYTICCYAPHPITLKTLTPVLQS